MSDIKKETETYQVRAGTLRQWDVLQAPADAPIASFDDKAAALNYAMCLARGRVAWHLLLRPVRASKRNSLARRSSTQH